MANEHNIWPELTMGAIGKVELLAKGFLFTEGPVWNSQQGLLLFSDITGNTIYQLNWTSGEIKAYRQPSRYANGLAYDRQGNLLAAEHGSRSLTRQLSLGDWQTIADCYQGGRLHSPNDIAVHSDGSIYFTDPPFGLGDRTPELPFMGLYRLDTQGELNLAAAFQEYPNGLAFSPDETILYVALTAADKVIALDVLPNGSLGGQRDFAQVPYPDGMAVDQAGNLFVCGWEGVVILRADGSYIGTIATELPPANCALAGPDGKTLVITARSLLYKVKVPIPGLLHQAMLP